MYWKCGVLSGCKARADKPDRLAPMTAVLLEACLARIAQLARLPRKTLRSAAYRVRKLTGKLFLQEGIGREEKEHGFHLALLEEFCSILSDGGSFHSPRRQSAQMHFLLGGNGAFGRDVAGMH
jgi:hypothetical protein